MRPFIATAAFAIVLAVAVPAAAGLASAPRTPEHDLAIGPSVSYVNADGHGWAVNVDASWSWSAFTASLNGKVMGVDDTLVGGAQLELTLWYFLNVGGGVGYFGGDRSGPAYHVFLGGPVPVLFEEEFTLYVEPFYRPTWFDGGWLHETGVLFKITTWGG